MEAYDRQRPYIRNHTHPRSNSGISYTASEIAITKKRRGLGLAFLFPERAPLKPMGSVWYCSTVPWTGQKVKTDKPNISSPPAQRHKKLCTAYTSLGTKQPILVTLPHPFFHSPNPLWYNSKTCECIYTHIHVNITYLCRKWPTPALSTWSEYAYEQSKPFWPTSER